MLVLSLGCPRGFLWITLGLHKTQNGLQKCLKLLFDFQKQTERSFPKTLAAHSEALWKPNETNSTQNHKVWILTTKQRNSVTSFFVQSITKQHIQYLYWISLGLTSGSSWELHFSTSSCFPCPKWECFSVSWRVTFFFFSLICQMMKWVLPNVPSVCS